MSLFVVDEEKCKRDGICVAVCPMGIIEIKDQGSVPNPTEDADKLCINCGHCVAVCPHGALSLDTMPVEQCPPVRKEWQLGPEQVEHFLRARRSIRNYKEQGVAREVIAQLIDIARYAPSGHNLQPVHWLVIYQAEEVQRLASLVVDWMRFMVKAQPELARALHMEGIIASWEGGGDLICRGAPHVIVAHGAKDDRTAPVACTIALTYLELAAPSFGVGACWAGYFNAAAGLWPPLQEALGLPEGRISLGAMMIGHPQYHFHRLPLRNEPHIMWR